MSQSYVLTIDGEIYGKGATPEAAEQFMREQCAGHPTAYRFMRPRAKLVPVPTSTLALLGQHQPGVRVAPGLPPLVYAASPCTGFPVAILRGVEGWHAVATGALTVEQLNATLSPRPTPQQIEAMLVGCMFGWHAPGADPAHPAHSALGSARPATEGEAVA